MPFILFTWVLVYNIVMKPAITKFRCIHIGGARMDQQPPQLQNKVIIMNGFSNDEIARIMAAVKPLFDHPRDLIFAKTTRHSVEMKLKDLIVDISEDHEYLKKNPPTKEQREAHAARRTRTVDSEDQE